MLHAKSTIAADLKTVGMINVLTTSEMQANVALSREHVIKQEAIIARLTEQGHEVMATAAKTILVTMRAHLATEIEMLTRMELS